MLIVSGDKDLKQCLGPNVYMWDPAAREEKLLNEAEFRLRNGPQKETHEDGRHAGAQ